MHLRIRVALASPACLLNALHYELKRNYQSGCSSENHGTKIAMLHVYD
jgi:hypothetical protein